MKLIAVLLIIFSFITQSFSQEKIVKEINSEIQKVLLEKDPKIKEQKLQAILRQIKQISAEKINSSIAKQISLCNYLIEQACILEALDGRVLV